MLLRNGVVFARLDDDVKAQQQIDKDCGRIGWLKRRDQGAI